MVGVDFGCSCTTLCRACTPYKPPDHFWLYLEWEIEDSLLDVLEDLDLFVLPD